MDRMYYSCLDIKNRFELYSIIDEFISYTRYHHPAEEQIMRNNGMLILIDIFQNISHLQKDC